MIYLTKGGFWVSVKRTISVITGLSLSSALANLLPREMFGNYKFLLSAGGILTAFSLTGMGVAVTQAVSQGYEGSVKKGLQINLRWSVGMIVLSLGASLYYYINENNLLGTGFLILATTLPLIQSFNLAPAFLKGKKEFKKEAYYSLPRLIVPFIGLLIAVILTDNPVILVLVYFVSQAIIIISTYYYTLYKNKINDKINARSINFSKHLSVMNILETVAGHVDKIMLFSMLGATPLAIYAFAVAPIRELRSLKTFFLTPAFPKLSQRPLNEFKKTLPYRMVLLFLILLMLVGSYILLAPYIYRILFPLYTESVLYSQVFSLTLLFMPIAILKEALTAHLKKKELYIIKTTTPLLRISSILILLPLYGIWGVILAILLVYVINAITMIWLFKKL